MFFLLTRKLNLKWWSNVLSNFSPLGFLSKRQTLYRSPTCKFLTAMVPQPLPNPSPLAPLVHVCTEESVNRYHVFIASGTTIITDRTTEVFYYYAYSTRKRMSVIVRTPEGKIKLYCKGAVSSGTLNSPQTKSIIDCKTVVFFFLNLSFSQGVMQARLDHSRSLGQGKNTDCFVNSQNPFDVCWEN